MPLKEENKLLKDMKIYKYKCSACGHDYVVPDKLEECSVCGDEKIKLINNLLAQDYLDFAYNELENANYHNQTHLPEKLFNEIKGFIDLREEEKLELARIIAEEFYNNI